MHSSDELPRLPANDPYQLPASRVPGVDDDDDDYLVPVGILVPVDVSYLLPTEPGVPMGYPAPPPSGGYEMYY
jgi:hypothetical protein